jgi:hypothetical protein
MPRCERFRNRSTALEDAHTRSVTRNEAAAVEGEAMANHTIRRELPIQERVRTPIIPAQKANRLMLVAAAAGVAAVCVIIFVAVNLL